MYQPLLLANLLRYFASDKKEWSDEVYYSAAGIILLSIMDAFISHYTIHCTFHVGLKIKVACTALIYQKILKLSNSVLDNETSVGQVSQIQAKYSYVLSQIWRRNSTKQGKQKWEKNKSIGEYKEIIKIILLLISKYLATLIIYIIY